MRQRGPDLPYRLIAGVVPCPGGWLLMPGKMVGIGLFPEAPEVFDAVQEIVDHIPSYTVLALASPIGLLTKQVPSGRDCDREARRLLGWPRSGAIASAPCRQTLTARTHVQATKLNGGHMNIVTFQHLSRIREVTELLQPYHQRSVYEVHPELSFYDINGSTPLRYGKHTERGRDERRALLVKRMPGIQAVLGPPPRGASMHHVFDAAAALWTARKIHGRSVSRVPSDPTWDDEGLRMQIVR